MAERKLRVAFVADGDPMDATVWSGIPRYMLQSLERQGVASKVVRQPWAPWYRFVGRGLKALSGRRWEYTRSDWFSRLAARRALAELAAGEFDAVLAVTTPITSTLTRRYPVVALADATLPGMLGYYQAFTDYSPAARSAGMRQEAKVLKGSLFASYPSHWAAASATRDYGVAPEQVVRIDWGANMADLPEAGPRVLPAGEIRLLFVGIDWPRKGGAIALEAVAELRRQGFDAVLDVVGCTAEVLDGPCPDHVMFHGFVSKNSAEGVALIDALYRRATFFVLPTKAEAWGIVFAEAAHHALPSVSFATGGVSTVVRDGETGVLLPEGSDGIAFANALAVLLRDPERYAQMSATALEDARTRLDWDVWASRITAAIQERLEQRKGFEPSPSETAKPADGGWA